jgi:hypothetical protein
MQGVIKFDQIFISSDTQEVTFVWIKSNIPFPFPYCKLARSCSIYLASIKDFDGHVCNGVVCK